MIRRRILLACAAVLLVGAASFVYAQGTRRHTPGPYRVVVIDQINQSSVRNKGEEFLTSRDGTEAINQLHAEGYDVVSMSFCTADRMVVILRKS